MEGRLHHIQRTIQTNHHVFRIIELTHHFPKIYERFVQRHDNRIVYMDNMLITTANKQENVEQTRRVLQRMKELDLHLKLKKCKFGVKEVDFLGLIL